MMQCSRLAGVLLWETLRVWNGFIIVWVLIFFTRYPRVDLTLRLLQTVTLIMKTIIIMTILISLSLSLLYIIIFTSIIIVTLALFFFELWNNKWELMLIFFTDSSTDLDQTIQEITSEIDPLKSKHSTLVSTKDRYQLTDPKLNLKSDGWRCYLKIILRELKRLTLNHKKRWSLVKLEQDWNHLNPSPPSSLQWEETAPCLIIEKEFKIV